MKILIVASYNKGRFAPFIVEQVEAFEQLTHTHIEVDWFGVQAHGIRGYLNSLPALRNKIELFKPDVIHAHYGLSGLLATLQTQIPVVITYHGSDINKRKIRLFSQIAVWRADWNIFVSNKLKDLVFATNYSILPCGINLNELPFVEQKSAREQLGWSANKDYILFAGAFDNAVKNYPLANQSVTLLGQEDVELVELKGYSREQVTCLMCAADCLLLTSHTEGSPQVIKEAMAAGCPIVSVDVGDVRERIGGIDGCYVADNREPEHISNLLRQALMFEGRTDGRKRIIEFGLDNKQIAEKLLNIYQNVVK